jgi:TPR repeat protein
VQFHYLYLAAASDNVYQLLAHGRWFSPGTPASSTTKTGRHHIAEILLKVALDTINEIKSLLILDDAVKIQIVEGTGWLTELGSWIT